MTYKIENDVLHPVRDDSFIAKAKTIVAAKAAAAAQRDKKPPQDFWAALTSNTKIRTALDAVLARGETAPRYDEVEELINTISSEYLVVQLGQRVSIETPALICFSLHNHLVPEDHYAVAAKPDWVMFMGKNEGLASALLGVLFELRPWGAIDGTGEDKPKEVTKAVRDLIGQLKWYVMSNKRYRPDLATVYGFQLTGSKLRLSALNAFGLLSSEAFEYGNVEAWIALVVLIYHASETRDTRMTYDPSAIGYRPTAKWNISYGPGSKKPGFSVFPSYASLCPGRMTWTAFQPGPLPESVRYTPRDDFKKRLELSPAVGFLKVSWQRPSIPLAAAAESKPAAGSQPAAGSKPSAEPKPVADAAAGGTSKPDAVAVLPVQVAGDPPAAQAHPPPPPTLPLTEGELLRHLHQDGWLPGLVRYHDFPQSDATIELKIGEDKHVRFKEVLHLASVGKPLSQCTSPQHLLEVAYDLTETHLQMLERDILHRDLSWFNVLIEPEHDPKTLKKKKALTGIPCIKKIFGDENGEPVVLLVDLDHAAHVDRIWKPGYETGIERTGTPMFVAVELSGVEDDQRVDYTEALSKANAKELTRALEEVESHDDIYQRAFPDGSGKTFMENFAKVIAREKARREADEPLDLRSDPRELHRAHHDVETIYWTLLWSFARALPKGSEAYSKTSLDVFCHQMLTHELGEESARLGFLHDSGGCRAYLHTDLKHFARLFRSLALYFSIPWHIYVQDGTVKIDHAHHAIRRLLLRELIFLRTPGGQKANVAFDTTQPRIYMPKGGGPRKTLPYNEMMTGVRPTLGTGSKRKMGEASLDTQGDVPDAKKAKVGEAPAEQPKGEAGTSLAHPRSAKVLQDMFREARLLWFGTGRRG